MGEQNPNEAAIQILSKNAKQQGVLDTKKTDSLREDMQKDSRESFKRFESIRKDSLEYATKMFLD